MRLAWVAMLFLSVPIRSLLCEDRPEIVLQTGSSSPAAKLAFSPDGRLLASMGAYAGSIVFWEWQTGRELRSVDLNVRGADLAGATFVFTPDGSQIIVAAPNRVWRIDVANGRQLQNTELPKDPRSGATTQQLLLSGDGRRLASMDRSGNAVKIWDVWTAKEIARRSIVGVNAIALSPDGKLIAVVSQSSQRGSPLSGLEMAVNLWEVDTGQELRGLTVPPEASSLMSPPAGVTRELAFSPDGRYIDLLIRGEAPFPTNEIQRAIQTRDSASFTQMMLQQMSGIVRKSVSQVIVWETVTGRLAVSKQGDDTAVSQNAGAVPTAIGASAFSRDGAVFAAAMGTGQLHVFDVKSSSEMTWQSTGRRFTSVAVDLDGSRVGIADDGNWISVLDAATGRSRAEFGGSIMPLVDLALAPDGRTLKVGGYRAMAAWNLGTGIARKGLSLPGSYSRDRLSFGISREGGFFSPDGGVLAAGSTADASVKIWDTETGRELTTFPLAKSHELLKGVFSPDGKLLAITEAFGETQEDQQSLLQEMMRKSQTTRASDQKSQLLENAGIRVIETTTGLELRTLDKGTGSKDACVVPETSLLESTGLVGIWSGILRPNLAFSPDGKLLVCGNLEGKIKLWEVDTGRELRSIKSTGKQSSVLALSFSPDGRTLAAAIGESPVLARAGSIAPDAIRSSVQLFDVATGKLTKTIVSGVIPRVLRFSPDGKLIATAGMDTTVRLLDVAAGQELQVMRGHHAMVRAVIFTPDSRLLVSASEDGSTRLWSTETGRELATLVSLYSGDWLAVTPDGLFDGSPGAWDRILWRFSDNPMDVAPVEVFFSEFYYPGLIAEIAAGGRPKAAQTISQKDRRQPVLRIGLGQNSGTARLATVSVEIVEAAAGAQDVRLFRNGSLVKVWHGDVLRGQKAGTLIAEINLVAGENRLTAYAFNHDNIKSLDAVLVTVGSDSLRRKGVAYIVAIGIDRYANPEFQLKYAVADATDFGEELQRRQQSLGVYERVEVVPLLNENSTKAKILEALAGLAKRAQPEDTVVIYFAGHGTALRERFYLVPEDLGYQGARTSLQPADLTNILEHSISDIELQRVLEGLDAGRMMLVIDACRSGQALESNEKRRGPMNSKGLAQLAYEKGLYVLTAAQSYEAALEAAQLGHGLLSYALVEEGLKQNAADFDPKDGTIGAREWLDYAAARVPQLQLDQMRQARSLQHEIAFVEGEEKVEDLAKRSLQQPRIFYRRELEQQAWIVSTQP